MKFELNEERTGYILTKGDDKPNIKIPEIYRGKPVVSVGAWAFSQCVNLISITIPNNVKSICMFAFVRCTSLTSVIMGDSVASIGSYAFIWCDKLTNITIPDSVTSIGKYAFYNCSSLTSVIMGDSVISIGQNAFSGCSSLTSITIPDSVTSIGYGAFCDCSSLTKQLPQGIRKTNCVKGFDFSNCKLKCNDFIFKVGKTYEEDKAELCKCGFHACTCGLDVFNYYVSEGVFNYYYSENVKYYEVELEGITDEREVDSKICGTKITLLRELSVAEAANYRSKF